MKKTPKIVAQMIESPPRTPPTIAPILFDPFSEDAAIEDVGDDAGDSLGVDSTGVDACASKDVGCEVESELGVVAASTLLGVAKKLSVTAFGPQAMYSNECWPASLINSTVEQYCSDGLEILR